MLLTFSCNRQILRERHSHAGMRDRLGASRDKLEACMEATSASPLRHFVAVSAIVSGALTLAGVPGQLWGATYVLPIVVRGVAGKYGSFWDSEVRILRLRPQQQVTIRRAWVALPGGGFADDPTTAPAWDMRASSEPDADLMTILTGAELMAGVTATHAAVGLEIEGEVEVFSRAANTEGQPRLVAPSPSDQGPVPCCLPGSGQLMRAFTEPLEGKAMIPWAASGDGIFRTNIGIINPTANWLHATVTVYGLQGDPSSVSWRLFVQLRPIKVDLAPWGWRQLNDVFQSVPIYCPFPVCTPPVPHDVRPAFAVITPGEEQPYFAYTTVLYSPLNDPEFIPAVPGVVEGLPQY
jgi:hypothetical protein